MHFTKEQCAGQRLMVGFDGYFLDPELKFLIHELKVGGIILFSRNIQSPEQVRELSHDAQAYTASCGQPPLFIAIDQEGGQVARLKEPFTLFPDGNPGMKHRGDAARFADITARELLDIGVNMNMAPVLDVQPQGFEGIMAKRVFTGGPDFVAAMGAEMIRGFQRRGIMAVAKHFPGIGRTTLDSHLHLPVLETSFDDLDQSDLVPFVRAITQGVSGIMMSHIKYHSLDPDWPASLSQKIVKTLLRETMGYQGVVMTDDLDMKAITIPIDESVHRIVQAHVDIALVCHQGPDIEGAFNAFMHEIEKTEDTKKSSAESLDRIMALKQQYL
ncbi:MAG: beta-N-acetylhexosaminidase [Proteobacteria bacterium]|nr:beta-N-acetylhexosaminidase [Pseudomonadota bacterium]